MAKQGFGEIAKRLFTKTYKGQELEENLECQCSEEAWHVEEETSFLIY